MSDFCVARVLTQLQHAEGDLHDRELQLVDQLQALKAAEESASEMLWREHRLRAQFLLGQIEALTAAQVALAARRSAYSQSHLTRRLRARPDLDTSQG